jgi:Arm DNA-binding domain
MIILVAENLAAGGAAEVIKKRGNSWWVVVYTGRDPLTGKKRQKTGTAKTRAEARQLEARLIREAGTGQHRAAGNKLMAVRVAVHQPSPGSTQATSLDSAPDLSCTNSTQDH